MVGRSFKYTFFLLILACAVSLGFFGGRKLRQSHPLGRDSVIHRIQTAVLPDPNGHLLGGGDEADDASSNVPPQDIFSKVLDHVEQEYVEGINSDAKLSNSGLARMIASLNDPKTNFLEPSLSQARQHSLGGRFQGIGATLSITAVKKQEVNYRYLTVVDTVPGGPAEKAGLKPGDHVTYVDGHWIISYSILVDADRIAKEKKDDAAKREEAQQITTRFKKGFSATKAMTQLTTGTEKTLQVTVERDGQAEPLKLELTTAETTLDPVTYKVVGNHIGYLRVRQFNPKAAQEFQTALKSAHGLKGLIVDLRDNPGGVRSDARVGVDGYDAAQKLIGNLTKGGPVATIERKPGKRQALMVVAGTPSVRVPLVVLVNGGTANLSELVASALHDAGRAKLVGARTFGDNVLQSLNILKDGAGIEMTTAHLLSASGKDLALGLTPDVVVAANGTGDPALDRALAILG